MYTTWVGNPYFTFSQGDVICVTTNGEIKKNGKAVMGAGSAKFARDTFKGCDDKLASYLKEHGNRCFNLGKYQFQNKVFTLATFPTKHKWEEDSDLELINKSASEIKQMADKFGWKKIYIPIPGGSNGNLLWKDIKKELTSLDSRFIIYSTKNDFR